MAGEHAAIHAAQEALRLQYEEEEEMTRYTQADLEGDWEFKIVRSASGKFKKHEVLQQVVQEESRAGWEMIELFDDKRIRFKRPLAARRKDNMLPAGVNPYRVNVGMSSDALGATIGLSIMGVIALFITLGLTLGFLN